MTKQKITIDVDVPEGWRLLDGGFTQLAFDARGHIVGVLDCGPVLKRDTDGETRIRLSEQCLGYVTNAIGVKKLTVTVTEGDTE